MGWYRAFTLVPVAVPVLIPDKKDYIRAFLTMISLMCKIRFWSMWGCLRVFGKAVSDFMLKFSSDSESFFKSHWGMSMIYRFRPFQAN